MSFKFVETAAGRTMVPCEPVPRDCPHGEYKWNCAECGGTGKCIHNKVCCPECGYSEKCIHKHRRYCCKECKGHGICQHNLQKYYCKHCNGGGVCKHDKRKPDCKLCKAVANDDLCKHNEKSWRCRVCEENSSPSTTPALTDANLEAHDFRLEFAAGIVKSFAQKRQRIQ